MRFRSRGHILISIALFFFLSAYWGGTFLSRACVGRTIYIGYYESEPEQRIISSLLAIFIDERTGTSVKLVELKNREQGFDYLQRNKVSVMVEYSGKILEYYGEKLGAPSSGIDFDSQRATIGSELKTVFVASPGFDSSISGSMDGKYFGKAYIVLSKKALSIFPALPRLLKKLTGEIDNEAMAFFIKNSVDGGAEKGTRSFLKKKKLI